MTRISDEQIMAYADGELDPQEAALVEQAIAVDPALAEKVARHRALRAKVSKAYAGTLDEPVPERLLAAVRSRANKAPAEVVDLQAMREKKRQAAAAPAARQWPRAAWGAMAASLIVGVLVGQVLEFGGGRSLVRPEGGSLVADGALDKALNTQLASANVPADEPVHVGISFVSADKSYCRTFRAAQNEGMAGIACREDGKWAVRFAMSGGAQAEGSDYRMASSETPPAVLQAVESMIAGEPLDAEREAAAAARKWEAGSN